MESGFATLPGDTPVNQFNPRSLVTELRVAGPDFWVHRKTEERQGNPARALPGNPGSVQKYRGISAPTVP